MKSKLNLNSLLEQKNLELPKLVTILSKLNDELRKNQFGSCSTGTMYRILLDKGYEVISRNQRQARESIGV